MSSSLRRYSLLVMLLLGSSGAIRRAQAAQPAPEAATAKLVGTWDATPALDEDVLQMDANQNLPFARASAVGVRMSYLFKRDGTMRTVTFAPSGPQDGVHVDQIAPKITEAKWSVVSGAKGLILRVMRKGSEKPIDQPLIFEGEDAFSVEVYDLQHLSFRSPFQFRRNVGERAVRWLRDNTKPGGGDSPLVQDMAQAIAAFVSKHEDFCIRLGGGLTKSGKVTELHGFCEQFFIDTLTEAQAKQLKLDPSAVTVQHTPRPDTYPVLSEAQAVGQPKLDTPGGRVDLHKPITGQVTFKILHTMSEPPDPVDAPDAPGPRYTARCTCYMGDSVVSLFQPTIHPMMMEALFKFSMKMPEKHADYTGPITMYFDLCRETKYEGGAFTLEVLSPAAEVRIEAGPAPATGR